ncbi:MAG: biopolymer transporter ExbD [Alphaproteobacteria bacterium]|nr:biopolymer transporter ExbD [Alphaproteobacteria bacterium]
MIALMFLLLPFLLLTTSLSRLVGLDLRLPPTGSELPPELPGLVESVEVHAEGARLELRAAVRRSDVVTSGGEVEQRATPYPPLADGSLDLVGLQAGLRSLKELDPVRSRALLVPDDALPARQLVLLMDALRADASGELFPEVALGGQVANVSPEAPTEAPTPEAGP